MHHPFSVLTVILFSSCAHTLRTASPAQASQVDEKVFIRSAKGDKEVLICGPKRPRDEDHIVVRLKCEGKEVLTLQSFQTVYSSEVVAKEDVQIDWRDDSNAVVVNLLINGGSQETSPYYITWEGCSAAEVSYEPIWPANHAGESNIYFEGWDNSGKAILKVR